MLSRFAIVAAVLMVLLVVGLSACERRMIYYPTQTLETTPDRAGLAYEDVRLVAADDVELHGWYLPGPDPGARPVVLFLHGNAGNVSHRLDKIAMLHDCGAQVFIVDYRGYGRSQGKPNEAGLYRDARAAYDHLVSTRGVEPARIVLLGESLGSAVCAELATQVPVGGVILEEAFTSIPDVAREMYRLPLGWLIRDRYETRNKIPRIQAPILLLHSREDEYFGMQHAERLRDASAGRTRLIELRGGHNDAFLVSADLWKREVRRFLDEVVSASDRPTPAPSPAGGATPAPPGAGSAPGRPSASG